VEVAAQAFGDDGDQAELQKGSPVEGPEEEVPGALDGERDGIDCRDGAHCKTFPAKERRCRELRN
jgi:hypothetical protein